jgi:TonB family protein
MQWPRCGVSIVALVCATFAASLSPSVTPDSDLRKELRKKYEGKLVVLSAPSSFDVIHFDGNGLPTRRSAGEPWTTAGLIKAEKVDVLGGQAVIDGRRVIVALSANGGPKRPVAVTTERQVHVSIDLPNIDDASQRNKFLDRVLSTDEVVRKIERSWHAEVDLSRGSGSGTAYPPDGKIGTLEGDRAVYAWESGMVSKPKAIYKPGPKYAENALVKGVSGTIRVRVMVNEKGFPEIMEIVEHLREGLDASALSAVSQWRFEPGLRNGEPAASVVVVELKFHLASKKKS